MMANWLAWFNESQIWRRTVPFRGIKFSPPTLDRWVALQAHRLGLMGKSELLFFDSLIGQDWHIADVGANQGLYSLYFSRRSPAGRVYAFEPDPTLFTALQGNVQRNCAANILLFNAAIADRIATLKLQSGRFNSGDNRIVSGDLAYGRGVEVNAIPLDHAITGNRLDFLKIDVQGFELQVLRGAGHLIQANRDLVIFLEFWPHGIRAAGSEPEELLHTLSQAGFLIFRHISIEKAEPFVYRANEWRHAVQFCNLVATRRQIFTRSS
jgi:FkbM family methyltransferase